MKSTSATVIPRRGAVVMSQFATDQGRSAIINLVRSDGQPIPFTAEVFDQNNNMLGTVGGAARRLSVVSMTAASWKCAGAYRTRHSAAVCIIRLLQAMKTRGKTLVLNAVPCKMQ